MSTSTRETEPKVTSPSSRVTASPARVASPPNQASRLAAISAEIPVEIHGSRTSPADGHPIEAFHEDTVSVIVFPQGGIVRLAAVVSAGQMIAVTNLNTQRGMLCRVANVRVYPNLKSYVELEFTQPAPGFWGVSFPPEAAAPEISHDAPATLAPESKSVAESAPSAEVKGPSSPRPAPEQVSTRSVREESSSDTAAVDELNLVHVTADEAVTNEPSAASEPEAESAPEPAPAELKPEDFWGTSFPAELMDASGIPSAGLAAPATALPAPAASTAKVRAPASSSIAPPAPSVAAVSKKTSAAKRPSADEHVPGAGDTKTHGAVSGDSVDLPIDGDETWDQLLSQLPKKYEQPKPAAPEIHEEDFHVEHAAPKLESRAAEAPRAAVPADELLSNSDQTPAQSESASPATLKELERLALEHLDTNQDAPHAPAAARKAQRSDKARRSPPRARVELPHTQPRIASSATALHSFTSPSPGDAHEKADFKSAPHHPDAVAARDESADRASFGNFLKDPEPRTSSSHAYPAHSDMLSVSLMDPGPAPIAAKARGPKAGGILAVAALAVIVVAGAVVFTLKSNTGASATSAVIGKPVAEQTPAPPGNLRPNMPDLPSNAPTSSLAAGDSSATPGTPDSRLEVELTTAVTPPSKNDASPSAELKPQSRSANRRSAIPPVTLSAPVSESDNPRSTSVEPAPVVNGNAAAASNSDAFSKLGANASAAIPRPAAPAASVSTGGIVQSARLIKSVSPIYPAFAKQNNIQGDVKIDATIDETGHVSRMKVISGPSLLQQPAMDALREWRYEPSTLDGNPVAVQVIVTLQFHR